MARKTKLIRAERIGIHDKRPAARVKLHSTSFSYGEYKDDGRTRYARAQALAQAVRGAMNLGAQTVDIDEHSRKIYLLTSAGPQHIGSYTTEKIILHRDASVDPTAGLF